MLADVLMVEQLVCQLQVKQQVAELRAGLAGVG